MFEPITGRYLRLALGGRPHRLYLEEAGEGIPLLLLHTDSLEPQLIRDTLNVILKFQEDIENVAGELTTLVNKVGR